MEQIFGEKRATILLHLETEAIGCSLELGTHMYARTHAQNKYIAEMAGERRARR